MGPKPLQAKPWTHRVGHSQISDHAWATTWQNLVLAGSQTSVPSATLSLAIASLENAWEPFYIATSGKEPPMVTQAWMELALSCPGSKIPLLGHPQGSNSQHWYHRGIFPTQSKLQNCPFIAVISLGFKCDRLNVIYAMKSNMTQELFMILWSSSINTVV